MKLEEFDMVEEIEEAEPKKRKKEGVTALLIAIVSIFLVFCLCNIGVYFLSQHFLSTDEPPPIENSVVYSIVSSWDSTKTRVVDTAKDIYRVTKDAIDRFLGNDGEPVGKDVILV